MHDKQLTGNHSVPNYVVIIMALLGIASTMDLKVQLKWNESVSLSASKLAHQAPLYRILDDTEQGYVNLGSLQSFTTSLTAQEKEDVINSILLAQLTATRMYSRETEYSEWYRIYVQALTKLGWMVDSYRFMEYIPTGSTINLTEATLKLLGLLCVKPIQLQVCSYSYIFSPRSRRSTCISNTWMTKNVMVRLKYSLLHVDL